MMDPLLRELVNKIPHAETMWLVEERLVWFRAFVACCKLVYRDGVEIAVTSTTDWPFVQFTEMSQIIPTANGKRNGGLARAAALSPERRVQIAKVAADARWRREMVEGDL